MFDKPQTIEWIDLERHMNDYASRAQMTSLVQKRYADMQKLFLRVQALSDKDFETAFSTFDSVVETLKQKKQKSDEKSQDNPTKNHLSNFITEIK